MEKPFLLPDVTDASELFSEMVPWDERNKLSAPAALHSGKERMTVGPYVFIKTANDNHEFPWHQCMAAVPSPQVLDTLKERCVVVSRDSMYFEIIVRADGNCHVIASYGQIIGSHWLTDRLRVETLPAFVRRTKEEATS